MASLSFRKGEGRSLLNVEVDWNDIDGMPADLSDAIWIVARIYESTRTAVLSDGTLPLLTEHDLTKLKEVVNNTLVRPIRIRVPDRDAATPAVGSIDVTVSWDDIKGKPAYADSAIEFARRLVEKTSGLSLLATGDTVSDVKNALNRSAYEAYQETSRNFT